MSPSSSRARTLPSAQSTQSYWRKQVKPIDEHRTTKLLPTRSDIVIIGAGYVGAALAHHLVEECTRCGRSVPSITILEAREACSGATGRNGGHLKPDPFSRAAGVLKTHGRGVAEHVASFEARQVNEIKELVEREGIDCDFEETRVTDVCLYAAGREKAKADLQLLVEAGITTVEGIQYSSGGDAEEISGIKGARSCLTYNAARLWPYKLVTHMMEKAVSHGVNLQTKTPVISVIAHDAESTLSTWTVNTPRGSIKTPTVIYATNGYTSALIPELRNNIVPVRGMCARLVGSDMPELSDSYMVRLSEHEYDYMISRPDGSIILGGGRRDYFHDLNEWFDVSDDSCLMEGARHYFDGYMQRHFHGWEDADVRTEEMWTGIMGYSNDGFPYVGRVCNKLGQYLCAGFSGHGMPQIFLSAKAVASMIIAGCSEEEVDLPLPYRISPERWSQQHEHPSLRLWRAVNEKRFPRATL